ncbi:hypothetical protein AVEN_113315-1 [Araneus ventricosus]|uniref:Uncharacterized protein n=1 Tax=Araneus ventricosus TaxID=182803 RepID=A0A4Y2UAU6_ARAVE|nr:hypothetical protein AVEN_113315-1 [Araneus ventricosus]
MNALKVIDEDSLQHYSGTIYYVGAVAESISFFMPEQSRRGFNDHHLLRDLQCGFPVVLFLWFSERHLLKFGVSETCETDLPLQYSLVARALTEMRIFARKVLLLLYNVPQYNSIDFVVFGLPQVTVDFRRRS